MSTNYQSLSIFKLHAMAPHHCTAAWSLYAEEVAASNGIAHHFLTSAVQCNCNNLSGWINNRRPYNFVDRKCAAGFNRQMPPLHCTVRLIRGNYASDTEMWLGFYNNLYITSVWLRSVIISDEWWLPRNGWQFHFQLAHFFSLQMFQGVLLPGHLLLSRRTFLKLI